jgi:uncharacterized protein (DUF39 family)
MNKIDETTLLLIASVIKDEGRKMDYGGGHVVKELKFCGSTYEIDMIDYGNGRKVWKDKELLGTIDQ